MIIQRFEVNLEGRDIAVGDIHGNFTGLRKALEAIHFNPEVDRLFATGDLGDKGPESHLTKDWLAKPWFNSVVGNHDDYINRHRDLSGKWKEAWGLWFMEMSEEEKQPYIDIYRKLPTLIEVATMRGTVGIVHAECVYDSWKDLKRELLYPVTRKAAKLLRNKCLFSRKRFESGCREKVKGVRAVVVGHNPVEKMLVLGNTYHIDTRGWEPDDGGTFTLLDLSTLEPCN